MRSMPISKIEVLDTGKLIVCPERPDSDFQFVYRAGNGVRWDAYREGFITPVPETLSHLEWLCLILDAVRGELGIRLEAVETTQYINVPDELKKDIPLVIYVRLWRP